jgi:streptogramin lyase
MEIEEDSSGMFWIGTWYGLNYFNPQTGRCIRYFLDPDDPNIHNDNAVLTMLPDGNGAMWIGTVQGGLKYLDIKTRQFTHYKHDPKNPFSISPYQINSIVKDQKGDLWLATHGGGVNRMDRRTGRFYAYKHNPADSNSINSNMAMFLFIDKTNTLWIGTREGGLNRMDLKTGKCTAYTTRHGLPSNFIVGILEDSKGNLWISTKNGLCSFDSQREVFQTYAMQDGLHNNDFSTDCLYKDKQGKLYFGGINGFTVFHPDSIQSNTYVPPVHITGFKIFDKKVNINKEAELSYQENFFSFDFVALNYLNSQKNQYAYRLEGFDKNWIYSGTRRYASYTNLDPGTYVFKVRGSNNNGIWNEQGASLKVSIHPPWWRTPWAYAFYFLCLLAGVFAFDRFQRRRLIAKEREKAREKELQQAKELEKSQKEIKIK